MSLGLYISDHRRKFVYVSTHRVSGYVTAINISIFKNRSLSLALITSQLPSHCQGVRVLGRTRGPLAGYCLLANCLQVLSPAACFRQAQWHYWWFTISAADGNRDSFLLSSGLVAAGAGAMNFALTFIFHSSRPGCTAPFCLFVFVEHFIIWLKLSVWKMLGLALFEVLVPSTFVLVFGFLQNMRNHLPSETRWSAVLTTLWRSCQWSLFCPA